jgi:fumarate reductase subunit D
MSTTRSEPLLWMLFSAGGIVSAMLIPIVLLLFGVAFPLGLVTPPSFEHISAVLSNPITKLVLLVLVVLSLFHFAHRFRHTVKDAFQAEALDTFMALVSYGAAALGSALAAVTLLRV